MCTCANSEGSEQKCERKRGSEGKRSQQRPTHERSHFARAEKKKRFSQMYLQHIFTTHTLIWDVNARATPPSTSRAFRIKGSCKRAVALFSLQHSCREIGREGRGKGRAACPMLLPPSPVHLSLSLLRAPLVCTSLRDTHKADQQSQRGGGEKEKKKSIDCVPCTCHGASRCAESTRQRSGHAVEQTADDV
jgi:hypothetical protein